jgi:hypothetical protein
MAEFIEFLSDNALKELQLANKELVTMVANVDKVGQKMKLISTPSGSDGAIKSLTDQYKEQEKIINSLQNQLTKLIETQKESSVSKAKEQKETKDLILTEREREKLLNKLNDLNKESVKENEKLKIQIQEKTKAVKEEVKADLGLIGSYDAKSKRLNELRKEYKNLVTQEGKATKETKELKKEIQALDKELKDVDAEVGQFQRNVGNYAKAMGKAGGVVKGAFTGGLIGGAIGSASAKASEFFSISKQAGDNAKTNLAPVLATLQVLLASLVDTIPVLIRDFQIFFKEIRLGFAELPSALGGSAEKANELKKEIKELNDSFQGKSYSEAFKDFGKRIEDTTEQIKENVKVNREAELNILKYSRAISKLTAEEETYRAIADDNNRSFEERAKAFERARVLADERAKAEIGLAKEQLKIAESQVKLQLKQAGAGENLNNILNDKAKAQKIDEETLANYVNALNAVTDAEGRRSQQIKQDSKEANDIQRDLFEQNLDYALDYTDNQKSINERLIADDRLTLEERKAILEETNRIFEKALEQQVKLFEGQTGQQIDITTLLNAEDSGTLLESVRALQMGEIETQRLLEVIRDYKTGVQDLSDANRDLIETERETLSLKSEIALQQKFLNGEILKQEDFDKQVTLSQIANLSERLATMKEGSLEYLQTLKELNDALISLKEDENATGEWLKDFKKGFSDDFISQSGFDKLFFLIENFDKLKEDGVSTALAISEAFQQAFNTISEYSNANFEQMYRNLEQQRDVSIMFAGESVTAREEIERQYEEKRRRIQRQQAESQKKLAIFNAVINTAQAVVAALPNVFLAAAVGVLGAAQIALIAGQPIPAFEKGGTHDGGLMLVNDGKGSNYAEKVVTPDGKVHEPKGRNVVMNAPKGTKIFTHDQWKDQLNNILLSNGINSVQTQTQQQAPIVNVQTKDNYHFSIDEQGIRKTITRGATKTQILNARFKQQKRDV